MLLAPFSFPFSCFPNPTLAPKTFFMVVKLLPAHWVTNIFGGLKVAICRESGDKHDDGKQLQSTADWSPASAFSWMSKKGGENWISAIDQKKSNPTGFPEPAPPNPTKSSSAAAATPSCSHSLSLHRIFKIRQRRKLLSHKILVITTGLAFRVCQCLAKKCEPELAPTEDAARLRRCCCCWAPGNLGQPTLCPLS